MLICFLPVIFAHVHKHGMQIVCFLYFHKVLHCSIILSAVVSLMKSPFLDFSVSNLTMLLKYWGIEASKEKIVFDIIKRTKGVFCQKKRKLCLNTDLPEGSARR